MEPAQSEELMRQTFLGRELAAVSFVRDYVELHFDGPILRSLTDPVGMWGCTGFRFPEGDSRTTICRFIGLTVDAVTFTDLFAQLGFGEHTFTVPLDDDARKGPEALHVIGVDERGRTDVRNLGIW